MKPFIDPRRLSPLPKRPTLVGVAPPAPGAQRPLHEPALGPGRYSIIVKKK